MKRFSLLGTVVLAISLLFTGCGGGGSAEGTWQLDGEAFKQSMKESALAEQMGGKAEADLSEEEKAQLDKMLEMFDGITMTLEILPDGVATMKATGMPMMPDQDEKGTWENVDGKLKITIDDDPAHATISGNKLSLVPPDGEKAPTLIFTRK